MWYSKTTKKDILYLLRNHNVYRPLGILFLKSMFLFYVIKDSAFNSKFSVFFVCACLVSSTRCILLDCACTRERGGEMRMRNRENLHLVLILMHV